MCPYMSDFPALILLRWQINAATTPLWGFLPLLHAGFCQSEYVVVITTIPACVCFHFSCLAKKTHSRAVYKNTVHLVKPCLLKVLWLHKRHWINAVMHARFKQITHRWCNLCVNAYDNDCTGNWRQWQRQARRDQSALTDSSTYAGWIIEHTSDPFEGINGRSFWRCVRMGVKKGLFF